jgi:hypothetical protein
VSLKTLKLHPQNFIVGGLSTAATDSRCNIVYTENLLLRKIKIAKVKSQHFELPIAEKALSRLKSGSKTNR